MEEDFKTIIDSYDKDVISKLDIDNALLIYNYLLDNDIYYAKEILIGYIDLFFYSFDKFKKKFESLINYLGPNYLIKLEEDIGLFSLINKF